MTAVQWLLLPIFLHVVLINVVSLRMGFGRTAAVMSGEVKRSAIVLDNRNWPDRLRQLGNNFDNQFQTPMLWYACVAFAMITGMADTFLIVLSWIFLASRLAHSYIHTGSNDLPKRFYVYLVGFGAVSAMWLWFAFRFFLQG